MTNPTFICSTCGQEHPGLPTDYGFRLPDQVHALDYLERYIRSRSNSDLCTLDESRFFMRGIIPVPFKESNDDFCWGIWVEVSKEIHDFYVGGFSADLSSSSIATGNLANAIPGYEETVGLVVMIHFQDAGSRPSFKFPNDANHALSHEQRGGITAKRHHDILENVGHFAKVSDA
jgi:hypothetical protein